MSSLLGTILVFWASLTSAPTQTQMLPVSAVTDTWTVFHETADFKIEVKRSDCHFPQDGLHQQWALLRYTNKTNQGITLHFQEELFYNEICKTCKIQEYAYQLALAPQQVLEASCDLATPKTQKVFIRFLDLPNPTQLTAFRFSKLTVH